MENGYYNARSLTRRERLLLKAACEKINRRDYVIIRLMVECGLRACEISRMKTENLRRAKIIRTETKVVYSIKVRGKWRKRYDEEVFISAGLMRAIEGVVNPGETWVFPGNKKAGLSTRRIREIVKQALNAAGLREHTAHHLRHTYAHMMYDATGDLDTLKKQLRHKNIGLTAYYAGVFEHNADDEAASNATAVDFDGEKSKTYEAYKAAKDNKDINAFTID